MTENKTENFLAESHSAETPGSPQVPDTPSQPPEAAPSPEQPAAGEPEAQKPAEEPETAPAPQEPQDRPPLEESPPAAPQTPEKTEAKKPVRESKRAAKAESRWYVVHTLSGHEQKVRDNLEKRIETMNMKKKIFQVLVPTEEEMEIKGGKKKIVKRKIFPGYVLVEMIMEDDSWYVVRNTAGVTGFVGSGGKPLPLPEEEVKLILKQTAGEAPKRRLTLKTGDKVRVTSGPFVEFYGAIQEVNPEKEKIKVAVSIFGRETPVELDYGQVEKL